MKYKTHCDLKSQTRMAGLEPARVGFHYAHRRFTLHYLLAIALWLSFPFCYVLNGRFNV